MSKFNEVMQETQEVFNSILDSTTIPHWVEFKLVSNNEQKELYTVKKMSELFEMLTDNLNVVIVLNEEIFDGLEDDQKYLVLEEALTSVSISDSDKISIEKPDFSTYSGMLQKHGDETMIKLKESIISLYHDKKEREEQMKEAKKNKNG